MKKMALFSLTGLLLLGAVGTSSAEVVNRIGGGVNYWTKLGKIDSQDVSQEGLSWLVTYQMKFMPLVRVELDGELLPSKFGGAVNDVLAPQAYVIVGYGLYAAAGVGIYYDTHDGFADKPFYALRAGVDFPIFILPLRLDLGLSYRFEEWNKLDGVDINRDTFVIGAAVRVEL